MAPWLLGRGLEEQQLLTMHAPLGVPVVNTRSDMQFSLSFLVANGRCVFFVWPGISSTIESCLHLV